MATRRRLIITQAPLPDPEALTRWKCEAIHLGFDRRSVILRLCWARWYWRVVQKLGPERRQPNG